MPNMEKKIAFGFNKTSKKPNLLINKLASKEVKNEVELIKYLEGKSIQLLEEKLEETPLIIPLKNGGKTSAALLSLKTRQAVLTGEELPTEQIKQETLAEVREEISSLKSESEDIEKRAAKELLAELNQQEYEQGSESTLVLPIKAEALLLDGAKEPTIDDYESIPITHFGKAMLRGMGWKDQPIKKGAPIEEGPIMRPKGMGLGADKALKSGKLLVAPEANEVLEIKKGACVRILGGKHKDLYGRIEGLDEHAGRVIVKMALGSIKESFNEFMVQPVSMKEYSQYSKCINTAKYDEYKRMEDENGLIRMKAIDIKNEITENYRSHGQTSKKTAGDTNYSRHKVASNRNSPESENNPTKAEYRSKTYEKHNDDYLRSSTSHKKYRRSPNRNRNKSPASNSSESSNCYTKHKKRTTKMKKTKKSYDRSRERRRSSDLSSDNDRRYKKKTKKSKRGRSRSRSKGRR